jgi:hypothetical protein
MGMAAIAYRFSAATTVTVHEGNKVRLKQLLAGDLFLAFSAEPDRSGMVVGTCNGQMVLVFTRDLAERAEAIDDRHLLAAAS